MKKFVGLARVSTMMREQEGHSLEVQEDSIRRYAEREGGEIVRLFRIAETASKRDERKMFREMLVYVRDNAADLDAMLFYKVDRATRNLSDY